MQPQGGHRGQPPGRGGGPRRGGGGGSFPTRQDERSLDELWPDYLKSGYFDEKKNLWPELVSRARVEPLAKAMKYSKPELTSSQARRFFQHCRAIEARLRDPEKSSWEQERGTFMMLDIAASDALGKSTSKIPRLFHDFIQRNVKAVKNGDDFRKGFLPHFEALIGFGAQYFRDRG